MLTCLKIDSQFAPVYLISAQMHMAKENFKAVQQALEQARSLDFEIRSTAVFHLLKAKLLEASGQTEDSLKTLEQAINLPGVRKLSPKASVNTTERISVFLELANAHSKLGHLPEATKV